MTPAATAFALLLGTWRMARTVPGQATFAGTAVVRPEGTALHYFEEGQLRLKNGPTIRATRAFTFKNEAGILTIFFADGPNRSQLFLRLQFAEPAEVAWPMRAKGDHPCGCDLHRAEYEFITPDRFAVTFRVSGPETDFFSATDFRRTN